MAYLKNHPELSGVPVAVFGVSKGGGVAIALAAEESTLKAVVTDGAFPVHSMVIHYSMQFIEIFSNSRWIYRYLPRWYYGMVLRLALRVIEHRKHVRYLSIERAMRHISGRPLLMINGQKDNYIKSELIQELISQVREPKELWIVPKAKHNRCLEREGDNYRRKVSEFMLRALPGGGSRSLAGRANPFQLSRIAGDVSLERFPRVCRVCCTGISSENITKDATENGDSL